MFSRAKSLRRGSKQISFFKVWDIQYLPVVSELNRCVCHVLNVFEFQSVQLFTDNETGLGDVDNGNIRVNGRNNADAGQGISAALNDFGFAGAGSCARSSRTHAWRP